MKTNLETMPIFGGMRKDDPRLTFGQYLTVLKEWHESIKKELRDLEEHLKISENCSCPICRNAQGILWMIEEILGEK